MDQKQPLGLPEGSVRALLAFVVVGTLCALTVMGRPISEGFLGLALTILGCYFAGRNNTPPSAGAVVTPLPPVVTVVPVPAPASPDDTPDPTLPSVLPS